MLVGRDLRAIIAPSERGLSMKKTINAILDGRL